MIVKKSIEIAAPPEKIWPFMVEPDNILKWCITFRKFEYSGEKRRGEGTPLYIEEKAGPMPLMQLNFVVTELVENKRFAFKLTSGNMTRKYEQSWSIESIPSGSRFTFVEDFELPYGIFGKLFGPLAQRSSGATVKKMLAILKELVEV